jgi:hypothetical protein
VGGITSSLTVLDAGFTFRGSTQAIAATVTTLEVLAVGARLTIFDLDTLNPIGEITG